MPGSLLVLKAGVNDASVPIKVKVQNAPFHDPDGNPRVRVLQVLADDAHAGDERHGENHAGDAPEDGPKGEGEEDDDWMDFKVLPKQARLQVVPDEDVAEGGKEEGQDFGRVGEVGGEEDEGEGEEGGDNGPEIWDVVQDEGDKAEEASERYPEEGEADADEDGDEDAYEGFEAYVAPDMDVDLPPHARRQRLRPGAQEVDEENEDEDAIGHGDPDVRYKGGDIALEVVHQVGNQVII